MTVARWGFLEEDEDDRRAWWLVAGVKR